MNSTTTSPDTHIDMNFTSGCHADEPNQSNTTVVPFLIQPSNDASKPLIFNQLRRFRICLMWCALDHSSCFGKFISYFIFIFFTILVPLIACFSARVPASAEIDDPISFNLLVQFPESGSAIIAFFTLSRFFTRYCLIIIAIYIFYLKT